MLNKLWRKSFDFKQIPLSAAKNNLSIHLTGIGQYSTLKNAVHKCYYHLSDDDPLPYSANHIVTEWYIQIALSWFIAESRELICAVYFSELGNINVRVRQLSAQTQIIDLTGGKTIFAPIDAVRYAAMQAAGTAYPQYLEQIDKVISSTSSEIKKSISSAVSKLITP